MEFRDDIGLYKKTVFPFKYELELILEKAKNCTEKEFKSSIDYHCFKESVKDLQDVASSIDNDYNFIIQNWYVDEDTADEKFESEFECRFDMSSSFACEVIDSYRSLSRLLTFNEPGNVVYSCGISADRKEKIIEQINTLSRQQLINLMEKLIDEFLEY